MSSSASSDGDEEDGSWEEFGEEEAQARLVTALCADLGAHLSRSRRSACFRTPPLTARLRRCCTRQTRSRSTLALCARRAARRPPPALARPLCTHGAWAGAAQELRLAFYDCIKVLNFSRTQASECCKQPPVHRRQHSSPPPPRRLLLLELRRREVLFPSAAGQPHQRRAPRAPAVVLPLFRSAVSLTETTPHVQFIAALLARIRDGQARTREHATRPSRPSVPNPRHPVAGRVVPHSSAGGRPAAVRPRHGR